MKEALAENKGESFFYVFTFEGYQRMSERRPVLLRVLYKSNMPGERAWFDGPECDRLVASGKALEVDKDGKGIVPDEPKADEVQVEAGEKNPFAVEGFSKTICDALASKGITTVEGLAAALKDGLKQSDLKRVSKQKWEDLVEFADDASDDDEDEDEDDDLDDDQEDGSEDEADDSDES